MYSVQQLIISQQNVISSSPTRVHDVFTGLYCQ